MNQTNKTKSEISSINNAMQAYICVGPQSETVAHVTDTIKQHLCEQQGCNTCNTCRNITQHQHHAVMWLYPEKQYLREQFNELFTKLSFALDYNDQFFFVIQKADFLTPACANSLLKSLEEPPPGYYFFLTAERLHNIIPTIRSRCIAQSVKQTSQTATQQVLFDFFTSTVFHDPIIFLKELENSKINERESIELLDTLLVHWMQAFKKTVDHNKEHEIAHAVIAVLRQAYEQPPMPGSSKVFWKDLYLQMKLLSN